MGSDTRVPREHCDTEAEREICPLCGAPTQILGKSAQPDIITGQVPVSGNDPDQ